MKKYITCNSKLFTYTTDFCLTCPVKDLIAAAMYLDEDDMTVYLRDDFPEFAEDIINIVWKLEDEYSGYIKLTTSREFSTDELDKISEWVQGQCSDGLGEGFEQQDFARSLVSPDGVVYDTYSEAERHGWDYDDLEEAMSSFDWATNSYKFR